MEGSLPSFTYRTILFYSRSSVLPILPASCAVRRDRPSNPLGNANANSNAYNRELIDSRLIGTRGVGCVSVLLHGHCIRASTSITYQSATGHLRLSYLTRAATGTLIHLGHLRKSSRMISLSLSLSHSLSLSE